MKKIIVYCEKDNLNNTLNMVSYEMIAKARKILNEAKAMIEEDFIIEALLLSSSVDSDSIKKSYCAGSDKFTLIKSDCFDIFSSVVYSQAFLEYYSKNPSDVIIFPATAKGRMTAPRITTLLNTGLVADCTDLEFIIRENKLRLAPTRPTFGSQLMATILSKKDPQCATIRPSTFGVDFSYNKTGEFKEYIPQSLDESRCKILRTVLDKEILQDDFSSAKIILGAGFGIIEGKDTGYLEKLEKIASVINAKVAVSRKLVDFNLASAKKQVGQTGSTINADLYIAFGISGAIQHIQGIKNCKTIIGINTDKDAEIFKYCDYKIVSDAKEIINQLYDNYNIIT